MNAKRSMKTYLRAVIVLAIAAMLAGCDSLSLGKGKFDNLLLTSLPGDRAFVASTYGPFGLTSELRAADAAELKRLIEKARMADEMLREAQAKAAVTEPQVERPANPVDRRQPRPQGQKADKPPRP